MRLAVTWWPWLLTALVVGPLMAPGYVLSYDMVFVPDLAMRSDFLGLGTGLPRAVPSDAVVALLDEIVPGMILQKVVLVAALVLAGVGARRLVPQDSGVAQLAATSLYVWNPYVAERLGIGHWPVLLAYASLPWVFDAARRLVAGERTLPSLVLWLALSASSAAGGLMAGLLAVAVVVGRGRGGLRRTAVVAATALAVNAPWVAAGLLHRDVAVSDPAAVAAFATRGEGMLPAPLAALGLGGIWNSEVVPQNRLGWVAVLHLVLVATVCVVGVRTWCARLDRRSRSALLGVGVTGAGLALAGALAPAAVEWFVVTVPGGGLIRDGSRFLALLAPLEVSLFGVGAAVVAGALRERAGRLALASGAVLMPLAFLPDLGWGLAGRLQPVEFPDEFARAEAVVAARVEAGGGGRLLVLPFSSYRLPSWNEGRRVLDPVGRYLPVNYVSSDVLYVSGEELRGEDPFAARVERMLERGDPPQVVARELRRLGITWVVLDREAERMTGSAAPSADVGRLGVRIFDGEILDVVELRGPVGMRSVTTVTQVGLAVAWSIAVAAVVLSAGALARRRVTRPASGSRQATG